MFVRCPFCDKEVDTIVKRVNGAATYPFGHWYKYLHKTTETLSTEIARKIQEEMVYPGQVKITVIRETRSVAFAK